MPESAGGKTRVSDEERERVARARALRSRPPQRGRGGRRELRADQRAERRDQRRIDRR